MARQYKTGLIITGDASGGIKAIQATDKHLQALNKDFTQGGRKARAFGQSASRAGADVRGLGENVHAAGEGLAVLKRAAVPVGAAIASMFAADSLRRQVDFADEMQKTNLRIGASTEALSQYNYVASLSGVQFNELATAWQRQSRRVAQAAQDTGEAQEALATLNLDARELATLAPEAQFERIAAAMNGVANEAQRVALAQKIWDSEGVKLLQIVNQGTDAIARMRAEADSLGLTISRQTATDMATFNDEMDRLRFAAEGVSTTLLADLVPAMTDGLQATSAFIAEAGGAEVVLDKLIDVGGALAVVYGGKLALGIARAAAETARGAAATLAAAQADARAAQAGAARTAENLRVAKSEQAAAQRALANAQATTAATGSTTNRSRALAALAVANQKALAAEASHTAAINTQAAAMSRASVVARGFSGALALLGGPAGAAILGVGALFAFREELGLVNDQAARTAGRIDQLTNAINLNSQAAVEGQLVNLTAQLFDLEQQAIAARARLDEVSTGDTGSGVLGAGAGRTGEQARAIAELGAIADEMTATGEAADRLREILAKLGQDDVPKVTTSLSSSASASKEAEKAAREQADALEALRQAMDPLRADHAEYTDRIEVLDTALAEGTITQQRYGDMVRWAAEEYVEAATGAEAYQERLESLVSEYDRSHRQAAKLEADLVDLNEAYRRGDIDGEQYRRTVAGVREQMRELALQSDPLAQDMARAWEEAGKRVDETFADAFRGAFDSFDGFADQLLDGFKRLLAELAYQATLRPIVVSVTGQMQGALGIPGAGGLPGGSAGGGLGGNGGLLSAGKQLWNSAQQGFGNIAWSGASNTAYAGGWAGSATGGVGQSGFLGGSTANFSGMTGLASAGAGYVGGWAGSEAAGAISDKQANSNYGQLAGTAIGTYFGGPIGAGIGSFVGSIADTLFGSGEAELEIAMQRLGSRDEGRWDHGIVAEGALGAVGFNDARSHEVADLWDVGQAKKVVESIAQMDNAIASLANNDSELEAMREIAQGNYGETGDPGNVVDRLTSRYDRLLEEIGGGFGEFVRGLKGDIGEVAQQGLFARESFDFVTKSAVSLNLQFEDTGASAYEAAAGLVEMVGGVQSLQSMQSNYLQSMYSDQERLARLEGQLGAQFKALGLSIPETREGFRDLVEAQDLNTESGRKTYAGLLQLVDGFDQLQRATGGAKSELDQLTDRMNAAASEAADAEQVALRAWQAFDSQSFSQQISLLELMGDQEQILAIQREEELAAMDEALRPIQERIWALQDEAQAQAKAAKAGQEYANALRNAGDWLDGVLGNISGWVDNQEATAQSPAENLASAQEQFARQLVLAEGGDRDALQSLTQYADRYLAAGEAYYASGSGAQRIESEILDALKELPEATSAEQFIVDGLREAFEDSLGELPGGIAGAIAPLFDSIDLDADGLIDYDEFGRQFAGLASDTELRRIFDQLDANGDGTISALEAVDRTTGDVEGNTSSLEERASEQLDELNGLVSEMARSTDQFVGLNSTMVSLRDAVAALGVAQEELARIEAERAAAEKAEQERLEEERYTAGALTTAESLQGNIDKFYDLANSTRPDADASRIDEMREWSWITDGNSAQFADRISDWNRDTQMAAWTARRLEFAESYEELLEALREEYQAEIGSPAPFAKGGVFTNSLVNQPTLFDMGLMGEAGPEAIMPLSRGADGALGVRAVLPPMPALPLLGGADIAETLRDLRRELAGLRAENARLLGSIDQHAGASVRVAQAGHQRTVAHLDKIERSNHSIETRTRLETMR